MSETTPVAEPQVTPQADPNNENNSVIKTIRAEADTAKEAAKEAQARAEAAEAKLQEIERSKLDETERLRLELEDAKKKAGDTEPLRNELGQYESQFEKMFKAEIEKVPAEQREKVEALADGKNYAERYQKLGDILSILPGVQPIGSVTQPTGSSAEVTPTTFTNAQVAKGEVPMKFKSVDRKQSV